MNAIYCRVSTEDQVRHGYSLDDQKVSCRNKLISLGFTEYIEEYADEGYSGEFLERPELDRLRDDLRNNLIKRIAIYDPDRLSRNLTNQLLLADEIEKAGAQIYFVTGDYDCSPEGKLFFSIRGAISAFEKAKIRERTLRGRKTKAKSGKIVINKKPYGFDWDENKSLYTINEQEAAIVRLVYDLYLNERMGTVQIVKELTRRGIMKRDGKPFHHQAIYRMLSKELYCGTAYACQVTTTKISQFSTKRDKRPAEEWIPIQIPAIIAKEQWEQARVIAAENSKLASRNSKRNYLLQGIIRCGECGMGMIASQMSSCKNKPYYRCASKASPHYAAKKEKCPNRMISVDKVEKAVWDAFLSLVKENASVSDFVVASDTPDRSEEISELNKHLKELQKKQIEIVKWFRSNLIDQTAAEVELHDINSEASKLASEIESLKAAQAKITNTPNFSTQDILNATTFEEKRKAIIQSGLKVHVKRINKEIEMWLSP